MKSILALCAQDLKRLLTNALFWVLTATLVVIVLVVNFALPSEVAEEEHRIVTFNISSAIENTQIVESEDAVHDSVREEKALGLVGKDNGLVIVHPDLPEKMLNAAVLALSGATPQPIAVINIGDRTQPIPYNKRMTPVFICFEALLAGFILGGALMLAEKEDATVKALRIAPIAPAQYLLAKTLLFSLIGTAYSILICVLTVGFDVSWLPFVALAFFGTAIYTLIGLAYTTLFKDMSSWFFSMALLLSVNMLPVISYSLPSFAPAWIRLIPSYAILFSFEKAMFGGSVDVLFVTAAVALWCLASYGVAHLMTHRLFLKGAKRA